MSPIERKKHEMTETAIFMDVPKETMLKAIEALHASGLQEVWQLDRIRVAVGDCPENSTFTFQMKVQKENL